MGKNEVIVEVAKELGVSQKDTRDIVELFIDKSIGAIAGLNVGEKFSIPGLGAWHMKATNARKARNPKTGESVDVPASQRVTFKSASTLKESVKA